VFYSNRVLFVHPPRCGGTWLTEWAIRHLYASADFHFLKHATRSEVVRAIPETARLQAFTIIRDEWERFDSFLAHCRAFDPSRDARDWTPEWAEICQQAHALTDTEFRRRYFRPMQDYLEPEVVGFSFDDMRGIVRWLHR
jgi:hypothetical protein